MTVQFEWVPLNAIVPETGQVHSRERAFVHPNYPPTLWRDLYIPMLESPVPNLVSLEPTIVGKVAIVVDLAMKTW